MAKNFSLSELVDLKNKYIQNKVYVACNPVFGKLDQFIKSLYQQKKWYILSENRIIFRTRTAAIGKLLAKEELWEPPYGVSSHGRYNDIDASVLYCANNKDVIKKEIDLLSGCNYNIAKLILHKNMRLFPINNVFGEEFNGLISEAVPMNIATPKLIQWKTVEMRGNKPFHGFLRFYFFAFWVFFRLQGLLHFPFLHLFLTIAVIVKRYGLNAFGLEMCIRKIA